MLHTVNPKLAWTGQRLNTQSHAHPGLPSPAHPVPLCHLVPQARNQRASPSPALPYLGTHAPSHLLPRAPTALPHFQSPSSLQGWGLQPLHLEAAIRRPPVTSRSSPHLRPVLLASGARRLPPSGTACTLGSSCAQCEPSEPGSLLPLVPGPGAIPAPTAQPSGFSLIPRWGGCCLALTLPSCLPPLHPEAGVVCAVPGSSS